MFERGKNGRGTGSAARRALATIAAGTLVASVGIAGAAAADPTQTSAGTNGTPAGASSIAAGLQFNGAAAPAGDVLRVVPASRSTAGSIFQTTRTSMRQSFESQFTFFLHGGSDPPADGLAFVIQNDPRGPAAIGQDGSAHGFSGVAPSLAVDFNIYDFFGCNCPTNQARLIPNGQYGPSGYNDSALVTVDPGIPLYGARVHAWVDYDATSHLLSVFLAPAGSPKPASPLFSYTVNLAALVGRSAYLGFTAATGALTARMDVQGWTVRALSPL
ncbi:MAG: L-type lectin-domain containing protein [Acidimicrobiales bacterium]